MRHFAETKEQEGTRERLSNLQLEMKGDWKLQNHNGSQTVLSLSEKEIEQLKFLMHKVKKHRHNKNSTVPEKNESETSKSKFGNSAASSEDKNSSSGCTTSSENDSSEASTNSSTLYCSADDSRINFRKLHHSALSSSSTSSLTSSSSSSSSPSSSSLDKRASQSSDDDLGRDCPVFIRYGVSKMPPQLSPEVEDDKSMNQQKAKRSKKDEEKSKTCAMR